MNSLDHALALVALARADARALAGMMDPAVFTDAIFGFHAQQAVEKGLKAWLASLDVLFPLTHDLSRLLPLLAEQGEDVSELWEWVTLTPFAVQHRYVCMESDDEPLDRLAMIAQVAGLLDLVASRICETGGLPSFPTPGTR